MAFGNKGQNRGEKFALIPIFSLLIFFSSLSSAQDLSIFDSRRAIAMGKDEKTYRDFYINGGIEHGVKPGMILTVKRRITLYDSYRANSPIEMMVDVGKVKIIHTQKGLSVARLYSKFSRRDRTILENDFIMVGDKIDMSSALMETQVQRKSVQQSLERPKKAPRPDVTNMSSVAFGPKRPPLEVNSMQ